MFTFFVVSHRWRAVEGGGGVDKASNFDCHEIITTGNYCTVSVASYALTICDCYVHSDSGMNHFVISLGKKSS